MTSYAESKCWKYVLARVVKVTQASLLKTASEQDGTKQVAFSKCIQWSHNFWLKEPKVMASDGEHCNKYGAA